MDSNKDSVYVLGFYSRDLHPNLALRSFLHHRMIIKLPPKPRVAQHIVFMVCNYILLLVVIYNTRIQNDS